MRQDPVADRFGSRCRPTVVGRRLLKSVLAWIILCRWSGPLRPRWKARPTSGSRRQAAHSGICTLLRRSLDRILQSTITVRQHQPYPLSHRNRPLGQPNPEAEISTFLLLLFSRPTVPRPRNQLSAKNPLNPIHTRPSPSRKKLVATPCRVTRRLSPNPETLESNLQSPAQQCSGTIGGWRMDLEILRLCMFNKPPRYPRSPPHGHSLEPPFSTLFLRRHLCSFPPFPHWPLATGIHTHC